MVQIIPQGDFGELLGTSISGGMLKGLEALQQQKLERMKEAGQIRRDIAREKLKEERQFKLLQTLRGLGREQPSQEAPALTEEGVEISPRGAVAEEEQFYSPEQLGVMALINKPYADAISSAQAAQRKESGRVSEMKAKPSYDFFAELTKSQLGDPQRKLAQDVVADAMQTGDIGSWTRDHFADVFGQDWLRSATGSAFLGGTKENFFGSISRAGPRPTQWLETKILEMQPKLGRNEWANLSLGAVIKANDDVGREQYRIASDLMNSYKGHPPSDFPMKVNEAADQYAKERYDELKQELTYYSQQEKKGVKASPETTALPESRSDVPLDPAQHKGRKARFRNKIYVSNGMEWIPQ